MTKENGLEYGIQNLSCDDDRHKPQQEKEQQKLVAYLQQQLEQKEQQLAQSQIQIKEQQQLIQFQSNKINTLDPKPEQQVQQQRKPFQVVLIDIREAANNIIRCVEKTLMGDEDLKYVAVSYRWGELHEIAVNTGFDYIASVRSFRLDDFFALCEAMLSEKDLQHMDYVWVDAICIDQTNHERRKATIYQMTNIYNRANYIVAVPDLQLQHIRTISKLNTDHSDFISKNDELIFQLLHGNKAHLGQIGYDETKPTNILAKQKLQFQDAVTYLMDLVTDWSTRVWVISEYNIAHGKNNIMKYWFIQLNREYAYRIRYPEPGSYYLDTYSFFEFDYNRTSPPELKIDLVSSDTQQMTEWKEEYMLYYNKFHSHMLFQLGERQFLETILKSKASRNEDRFHAVLPRSKYKHIIKNKDQVTSWKITDIISTILKLYEFMDNGDKLKLLFLSGSASSLGSIFDVLPSFAASGISWPDDLQSYFQIYEPATGLNFNLSKKTTITLWPTSNGGGGYKLTIKPIQYFKGFGFSSKSLVDIFWRWQKTNGKQLGFNDESLLQVVYIPMCHFKSTDDFINEYYGENEQDSQDQRARYLLLVGSYNTNRWLLNRDYDLWLDTDEIEMGDSFGTDIGFDIY